jgi:hypothetical protein
LTIVLYITKKVQQQETQKSQESKWYALEIEALHGFAYSAHDDKRGLHLFGLRR